MDIQKIAGTIFLMLSIGFFAPATANNTTTANALQDAQNAKANNNVYRQNQIQNQNSNDDPVLFNLGTIMSTAAGGAALSNLGGAIPGINSTSLGFQNDTNSTPATWKVKLKPWQIVLVVIFMGRELRELKSGGGSNGAIDNPNYESSPIGQIKGTYDIRSGVIVNLFKITGNITDKVGRGLSNVLAVFLLLMGTLELLIGILKGIADPHTEDQKTILMILKDMFPQMLVIGIMLMILGNGFFWNFYTGPLFNLSMKIGGTLSGQSFDMYNLPDYLTKLFNAPITVVLTGVKMLFSVKGVVNSILPTLILFAGFMLFWFSLKAGIEIMIVLVDYLLIGCFSMAILTFLVLRFTKNIGSGAIGGIVSAMINVIVMFTLVGFALSFIDKLDGSGNSSVGKLLGTIIVMYIINALIMQIKTIGHFLNSGSAAYIKGSSITGEIVEAAFKFIAIKNFFGKGSMAGGNGASGALKGAAGALKGTSGMNNILEMARKNVGSSTNSAGNLGRVLEAGKNSFKAGEGMVNYLNKGNSLSNLSKSDLSSLKNTVKGIVTGDDDGKELSQRLLSKFKMQSDKLAEKGDMDKLKGNSILEKSPGSGTDKQLS